MTEHVTAANPDRPSFGLLGRLAALVVACLLPIAMVEAYDAWRLRSTEAARTHQEAARFLSLVEGEQQRVMDGVRHVLATVRQTRAVRGTDDVACQELMGRLRGEYPAYLNVHIINLEGRVRCATEPRALGIDASDREHVRAALAGKPFHVGPVITSRATGRTILPVGMPLVVEGRVVGVVTATLDGVWLDGFLARRPLPRHAVLLVADSRGTVLTRAPRLEGVAGRALPDRFMPLLRGAAGGMAELVGLDGVPRQFAFTPPTEGAEGLFVAVGIDRAAALAPIDEALARSLGVLVLCVLASGTAAAWMGRRYIDMPVRAISGAARRWAGGDLSARAVAGGSLAPLASDLNGMAAALEAQGRALRESEARHRAVFETAVDAMVVIDEAGTVKSANPAAERTFGHRAADMLGRNVSMLMPDHHRDRHDGYVDNYRRTGERRIIGIGRGVEGRRADGSTFPLDLSIAEWRDGEGRRHFTGIMRDTSARRAAEQARAEGEVRLRLATEAAAIGIWDYDPASGVLRWDDRCRALFGLPPDAAVTWEGAFLAGLHPDDRDRVEAAALAALDPAGPGTFDIEYRTVGIGDGRLRWVAATGRAFFRDGRPTGFAGTVIDITARKASEDRQKLLAREVDHRARNALAVVSTVVRVTRAEGAVDFVAAIEGRVSALARAHRVLADGGWDGAGLEALAVGELDPFTGGDAGRARVGGPPVMLAPDAVQPMAMVLHELATNAAKHGALSTADGAVTLSWHLAPGGGLVLDWLEHGGPPVDPTPARRGFGTEMLAAAAAQLGGRIEVDRPAGGLRCRLAVPAGSLAMGQAAGE